MTRSDPSMGAGAEGFFDEIAGVGDATPIPEFSSDP